MKFRSLAAAGLELDALLRAYQAAFEAYADEVSKTASFLQLGMESPEAVKAFNEQRAREREAFERYHKARLTYLERLRFLERAAA